jgi:hypothetical protein
MIQKAESRRSRPGLNSGQSLNINLRSPLREQRDQVQRFHSLQPSCLLSLDVNSSAPLHWPRLPPNSSHRWVPLKQRRRLVRVPFLQELRSTPSVRNFAGLTANRPLR